MAAPGPEKQTCYASMNGCFYAMLCHISIGDNVLSREIGRGCAPVIQGPDLTFPFEYNARTIYATIAAL
jgi:hypothetical protein